MGFITRRVGLRRTAFWLMAGWFPVQDGISACLFQTGTFFFINEQTDQSLQCRLLFGENVIIITTGRYYSG